MNILHLLPPEMAHRIAIEATRTGLFNAGEDDARLTTTLFGKKLRNPIGLSAGADKDGRALYGFSRMGFGLIEVGTITPHPQHGNKARRRVWRLGDGQLINWLGLPSQGVDTVARNLEHFSRNEERARLMVGASIACPGGTPQDFAHMAGKCAPFVDYITLNASCPNLSHACDATSDISEQVQQTVHGAAGIPVMVKLGPTLDGQVIGMMVSAAMEAGATGIIATNTLTYDKREMIDIDISWPHHDGAHVGGYSGGKLLDISCFMISEIRKIIGNDAPLIGVGGVQSGADARRIMSAGVDAFQLYTGLIYKGPKLLREIKEQLLSI